jgi:two-component system sensor histidine kinase KdpD
LAELVARTLRHEVGDLLQAVYATAALVQQRLPDDGGPERRLLTGLRVRAEVCKHELDAVYDLISRQEADRAPANLGQMLDELTSEVSRRFPALEVRAEVAGRAEAPADSRWLAQAVGFLLLNACQAARGRVVVSVGLDPARAEAALAVSDDGPAFTPEQQAWLAAPFPATREARVGLGLALARRVAEAHGGRAEAVNLTGGKRVTLFLPAPPTPPSPA